MHSDGNNEKKNYIFHNTMISTFTHRAKIFLLNKEEGREWQIICITRGKNILSWMISEKVI